MRPWHRVLTTALLVGLVTSLTSLASASRYDEALRSLDFGPDPLARSARLLGMGRLSLLGDDTHNQISLWDFAANPIGIADDDSSSTFELRPASASHSAVREPTAGNGRFLRQTLAGNEYRIGYEGWRRTQEGTAYGATGNFGVLRMDQPYSETSERRSSLSDPSVEAAITGRVPWILKSPRWHYALRALVIKETSVDEYRSFVVNPTGEYLDRNGALLDQPLFLVPNQYDVMTLGGGLGLGYNAGRALQAAVVGDYMVLDVEGVNDGKRYNAATHERRPVLQGQGSATGKLGQHLEYGVDGRVWKAKSSPTWDFSISAGIGQDPMTGRGDLYDREEFGSLFHSRARWVQGPFEIGAGVTTSYDKLTVTPPENSPSTFNNFLNTIYARPNADSLALPDSVVFNRADQRTRDFGGGIAWHTGRAMVGVEAHTGREDLVQTIAGNGPRREYTEVRGGLELGITSSIQGRLGGLVRTDDLDVFTYGNKYKGNGLTLGLGLHPIRSTWSFDVGYMGFWYRISDGDPTQPRGSRQQFLTQLRWVL
jgi:hypothetical protein